MEVYECDTHIHKRRGGNTIWRQERDALGVSTPVSLQTCVCVKGEEEKEEEEGKLLPCWWCERAREMSCVSSGDGGRGDAHVRCARAWTCKCHM